MRCDALTLLASVLQLHALAECAKEWIGKFWLHLGAFVHLSAVGCICVELGGLFHQPNVLQWHLRHCYIAAMHYSQTAMRYNAWQAGGQGTSMAIGDFLEGNAM